MGPFPLEDSWGVGVGVAITQLYRSLDKGKYRDYLQYDTTRKIQSAYSNCWGSSIHTLTVGVMARDQIKTYVTKCPTYTLWFERFAKGMHSRMGDDRQPDAAISIKLMEALDTKVDQDYLNSQEDADGHYIARAGLFFMGSFLGSLWGEETP